MKKQNFANNLKNLREKNNLTQSKLAKILNISRQAIYSYEQGKATPSIDILEQLTILFNCSLDSLVFTETILNTSKYTNINALLENDYSSFNALNILNDTKESLLKKRNLIDETLKDIDNAISKIKHNSNTEYSKELSISSETIDKIINFDKYKLKNSIDIDFYKNNNLKICDSSNSKLTHLSENAYLGVSLYGNISCGALKYTQGSIEDTFYLKKQDLKYDKSDYFILQIDGESMNKLYKNGDYILIHKNKNYEGYKPYVFILGDEATLKYVDIDLENRNIILVPHSTDSSYQKQILKFEDLNSTNFGILGTIEGVLNFLD